MVSMDLASEPKNYLLWLIWYVIHLQVNEPSAQDLLTRHPDTPTNLIVDLSGELGPQPKNRRGDPINLAGPTLACSRSTRKIRSN
jgi:hypothetical protein